MAAHVLAQMLYNELESAPGNEDEDDVGKAYRAGERGATARLLAQLMLAERWTEVERPRDRQP